MKLTNIKLHNFRSISDLEISVYDFTSLIGPNNCGKSSIIRAIEIILNQSKPHIDEWKKGLEDQEIIIEGTFEDIEDWERDTAGISGLVNDSRIRLRIRASITADKKVETVYEAFIKQYEITGWSDKWGEMDASIREIAATAGVTDGTAWRTKANKERVREVILKENPELHELIAEDWTSENISISAALKQALPKAVIIPAVKDAADEIKPTSNTIFGTLLSQTILPAIQSMPEYLALVAIVDSISDKLSNVNDEGIPIIKELTQEITTRMSSIIESKIKVSMSTPDTDKFVGSSTTLLIDDGTETAIGRQGHGAQRALIFALIEVLANRSSIVGDHARYKSTILLFEEPELFLHPHLMIRLKNALKSISVKDHWQVIISTHSPFLVDVVDNPMSLVILNRASSTHSPYKNQLISDPFNDLDTGEDEKASLRASLDFHPTVNQAFFAKRVILVEGDSELALFNHIGKLHQKFEISEDLYNNTTIVSCGGKWTIVPFAKLLNAFQIPFKIIHDCDRKDRDDVELESITAIDPYRANEKIRMAANGREIFLVEDTLEHLLWENGIRVPSKDKPYRTWKRVHELLATPEHLLNFPRLKTLFEFAYKW